METCLRKIIKIMREKKNIVEGKLKGKTPLRREETRREFFCLVLLSFEN
jgi:hypothetical protein